MPRYYKFISCKKCGEANLASEVTAFTSTYYIFCSCQRKTKHHDELSLCLEEWNALVLKEEQKEKQKEEREHYCRNCTNSLEREAYLVCKLFTTESPGLRYGEGESLRLCSSIRQGPTCVNFQQKKT